MVIEKRGLSEIITSLIMILLAIVGVGVVWVIVVNIVSDTSKDIETMNKFQASLDIKSVNVQDDKISIKIKREIGGPDLSGIQVIISDGTNTQTFILNGTLKELEEKIFELNYSGVVKEILVLPIFEGENGKTTPGQVSDTKKFTNKEIVLNLNPVSWYRFEGNANDEMGRNNGVIQGANCNSGGKYGQACYFDGADDYIDTQKPLSSFFTPQTGTILLWVKPKEPTKSGMSALILNNIIAEDNGRLGISIGTINSNKKIWVYNYASGENKQNISYNNDEWTQIVWMHSGGNIYAYKNGEFIYFKSSGDTASSSGNLKIGARGTTPGYFFNGDIDEIMIFNRSLSVNEIKALYNLDLNKI